MFEVQIETLKAGSRQLYVVRDDLLGGGTKERACRPFLERLGEKRVVYASPFCGFAQVALAKSARDLGLACTIFAERDPGVGAGAAGAMHDFTRLAEKYGAHIELCSSLDEATALARTSDAYAVPLGFDHPIFHEEFERALKEAWSLCDGGVTRVWLPLGSGTFANVMRKVVPLDTEIALVDVGVLPAHDSRILKTRALPNVTYHRARELFAEPCATPPPIPSNRHYDAKLWGFLLNGAGERDLWWNVAR